MYDDVWLDFGDDYVSMGTYIELNQNGIIGGELVTLNTSTAKISGGTIGENIGAVGDSKVEIISGTILGSVFAEGNSLVEIFGSSIVGKLSARVEGTIKLSGGVIEDIFEVWHGGVIELHGSNFSVGGENLIPGDSLRDFGTLELLGFGDPFYTGIITGTLSDGTELNNYFMISDFEDGDIVIVPEPATLTLFITGLGALAMNRKA